MPLAREFHTYLDPQGLSPGSLWSGLALPRHAAYQRRFYVHGLREAAHALGLPSARALWGALERIGLETGNDLPGHKRRAAVRAVIGAVPQRWKDELPDINDKGDAAAHTTYWRQFSESQLLNAWETRPQSLPKALLSIACLCLAAEASGVEFEALSRRVSLRVRPSLFWLLDYSPVVHDRHVAASLAASREAYRACGLEFDLGPDRRSDALGRAATGEATLTFDAAERLRLWLEKQGALCGPVRLAPDAYKRGVAEEVLAVM